MDSPNAATATTARYDPAVTARVSGEASELRVSDCSRAPAIPSANPTAMPAANRGIREPTRICRVDSAAAVRSPVARAQSSPNPTPEVPWVRCQPATSSSSPGQPEE